MARQCRITDPSSPVVIGCDPARTKDRTVVVIRRGREVVKWLKYETMDEMMAEMLAGPQQTHLDADSRSCSTDPKATFKRLANDQVETIHRVDADRAWMIQTWRQHTVMQQ
jgi:hypothetical protein